MQQQVGSKNNKNDSKKFNLIYKGIQRRTLQISQYHRKTLRKDFKYRIMLRENESLGHALKETKLALGQN